MKKVATNPSDHLRSISDDFRDDMIKLDTAISAIFVGDTRVLWKGVFWGGSEQNIIGYGDITYTNSKKEPVDWFAVGLAQQKDYISVYVNAVQGNSYITDQYKDKIGKAKVGKSSIGFKKVSDINLEVLLEMVSKAKSLMSK